MGRQSHAAENRAVDLSGRRGRDILRDHDPLGLIAAGAPDDEYDCVVAGVMVELMSERDATLPLWISEHVEDHFGMTPDDQCVGDAARALVDVWRSEELAPLRS